MYAPEPNSIISNTVHGESLIHCRHFAIDGEMATRRISMLKLQGSLATWCLQTRETTPQCCKNQFWGRIWRHHVAYDPCSFNIDIQRVAILPSITKWWQWIKLSPWTVLDIIEFGRFWSPVLLLHQNYAETISEVSFSLKFELFRHIFWKRK